MALVKPQRARIRTDHSDHHRPRSECGKPPADFCQKSSSYPLAPVLREDSESFEFSVRSAEIPTRSGVPV